MNFVATTYIAYLLLSLAVTVVVGGSLHRNGRAFLIDVFAGHVRHADAVNHLLLVGFSLLNIAFALFNLRSEQTIANGAHCLETLASRMGILLTLLGGMHYVNVAILLGVRQSVRQRAGESRETR